MKNVILLADPKTHAWEFAKKVKGHISNMGTAIALTKLNVKKFRNGELLPSVEENIRKKDVYYIQSTNKSPNDWWAEILLTKDMALSSSVNSLGLVLPNMCYSRQDRKHKSRVPISTRAVANSISKGLKRIITMDLHAPQIQSAYPSELPFDNLYSFPEAVKHLRKNYADDLEGLAIVSPDGGGVSRVKDFYRRMIKADEDEGITRNYSMANILKLRDSNGEIIDMQLIGDVNERNILIVDDMYDSCGTTIECGKLLREKGAKKMLTYATHGLFTKGTKDVTDFFDSVLTSNTHYSKSKTNSVDVIDMSPLFAEAIYRAQKGLSISKLFD